MVVVPDTKDGCPISGRFYQKWDLRLCHFERARADASAIEESLPFQRKHKVIVPPNAAFVGWDEKNCDPLHLHIFDVGGEVPLVAEVIPDRSGAVAVELILRLLE